MLQSCCAHFCRTWSETYGGRFPPSNHAPGCLNFIQKPYCSITLKETTGPSYIIPKEEYKMLKESGADLTNEDDYDMKDIFLTEDQYEKLDEFVGW